MSKKVPQIRFNGYSDTWTENQLSSLIKIARQQEIKKEQLSSKPEGYYVLAMRTFSKDGYIDFSKPYWIKSDIEDKNAFLLPGEFAIIDADMDTSLPKIGKVLLNSYNKKFLLAAHVRKINVQSNVNSYFMYGVMRNEQLLRRLKKESSGSIAQGLLDKNIYKQTVYIPKILEQEKIGLFFKEFENIIALHQHKLDLLKEQKKGYLQKMFPKNGAKVPELRFAGFADDWEERKLEDISEIIDGDRGKNYPSGDDFKNNGHTLFLSAANVTKQGFVFKETQYITKLKSESLGSGKVILNDIILTSRGSIGHIGFYDKKTHEYIPQARINSGMLILRTDKLNSPSFIAQFLKSPWGIKQIKLISFGSAQPQLTKKDIKNFKIILPKMEEQQKIGSFFKQLDDIIALHQRKLDLLKEQKKGFLQKMFV